MLVGGLALQGCGPEDAPKAETGNPDTGTSDNATPGAGNPPPGEIRRVEAFTDWGVFKNDAPAGGVCWVASEPVGTGTGPANVLLSFVTSKGELTFLRRDGAFASDSGVMRIGAREFPLFFQGKGGWLRPGGDDAQVRAAMAAGSEARVVVGGETLVYSLKGFTRAAALSDTLCT